MKPALPCIVTAGLLAGLFLTPSLSTPDVSRADGGIDLAPVAFEIHDNKVVPQEDFAVLVRVLGSAITDGAGPMPVTTRLTIGGERAEPWGSFGAPDAGNVNVPGVRPDHVVPVDYAAGTTVTVAGRSWHRDGSGVNIFADSALPLKQVWVLRDGDAVPSVPGFEDQASLSRYVSQYVENGRVSLHVNQIIYLYELGTLDLSSPAADFQDLVVLVTLGESVEALEEHLDEGPFQAYD